MLLIIYDNSAKKMQELATIGILANNLSIEHLEQPLVTIIWLLLYTKRWMIYLAHHFNN